MRGFCAGLVVLLFASAAVAGGPTRGSHLFPEETLYSQFSSRCPENCLWDPEYETDVLTVLRDIFSGSVFARAIIMPSFENEYAVGIAEDESGFKIVLIRSKSYIWAYQLIQMYEAERIKVYRWGSTKPDAEAAQKELEQLRASVPAKVSEVETERCERPVSSALGKRISEVWRTMLERTRYPDKYLKRGGEITLGVDGTSYHFSYDGDTGRAAGQIWSPDSKSITGQFVKVAESLGTLCGAPESLPLGKLEAKVKKLERELAKAAH